MNQNNIRNFCIIAHIDHGKSTLADRLLEITGTISHREMKAQLLDQMDLERERGITIKLQPVRMSYALDGVSYMLNLIDTPGHVDFSYEVSRSLAAVEGALLLVDATQGIQAQTIANLYFALEQRISIIPVINKIDLPGARREETASEIISLLGCSAQDIQYVSGKTGEGVGDLLSAIIARIPAPRSTSDARFRSLIFDSLYDEYRGVVAYVRVIDGSLRKDDHIHFKTTGATGRAVDVGILTPKFKSVESLHAGEIGAIATGLKSIKDCRVGDTIVHVSDAAIPALPGYKEMKPMVFAGIFSKDGAEFKRLRDAIEKLKLNDVAFTYEPEHSLALGYGFRCGFLGMLHLEIIKERISREYGLDVIVTVPSVAYHVIRKGSEPMTIRGPLELPDESAIDWIEEPWVALDIISPETVIGPIMSLITDKRGIYHTTEYLGGTHHTGARRVIMRFDIPLNGIIVDFYDSLKSISSGYASMNYDLKDYRKADVVRMDIIVGPSKVEELATIIYRDEAYRRGKKIVETLKESLPRQQFEIKLQAAIGSKIIAAERISAFRKDVTAGLYGGDVTRKQKLLAKQKKGKKRMQSSGAVDIPTDTYMSILKR
ncbi:elongation factor 4 [Candidatus Uhrbacteria bacterium]|nr:elongation factor 4 [Candidatus Uhrbacteria bacterium]